MITDNSVRLLAALKRTDLHDHLCLIYEDRKEQVAVTIPFIKIGLERNEKCLYIADDNSIEDVKTDLKNGGIDVEQAINSKMLTITDKNKPFLKEGYFNPDIMVEALKTEMESAKADGYNGLRLTVEMTWMVNYDFGNSELVEYESKLNKFFNRNDGIAISQFNRPRFNDSIILNVIRTHPVIIYGGLICSNVYYIPPDEFLQPDRKALQISRLLDKIRIHELTEMALLESREWFEKLNRQLRQEIAERKLVEEQLRLRANQQAAIAELGQSALEKMGLQKLINKAVNLVAETLGVEYVKILELSSDKEYFSLRAGLGFEKELAGKVKIKNHINSQSGYTLNTNNPVIVEDLSTETRFAGSSLLLSHKIVSGITSIIYGKDMPFGVLGVHTTKRRLFTRDDFNFLQGVANLLAETIERIKTNEKLKEFAAHLEADGKELRKRSRELLTINKALENEIDDRIKAEDELRDAHEFLQKIMVNATNAIFVIDLNGQFSFMNLASSEISGYSVDELIGKPFSTLLSSETFDGVNKQFIKTAVEGVSVNQVESQLVRKDGTKRFITFSLSPLYHDDMIVSIVGAAEDITQRKHAEMELYQRATEHEALSQVSQFLIQAESEEVIYEEIPGVISQSFGFEVTSLELYDSKSDEIVFMGSIGLKSHGLKDMRESTKGTVSGDVIRSGKAVLISNVQNNPRYEFKVLKKLNIQTFACLPMKAQNVVIGTLCMASSKPVSLHHSMEIILQTIADTIAQAIERKQAEEELKESRLQLEEQVEQRTAELKATQEKLIHSAKLSAVGKLAASIAHEFNNPICGIRNVLERINDRIAKGVELDQTHKELSALAIKECTRMAELIIKLQDFNKPSSGVVAPLNIHDAIDEMILMSNKKLKDRKIEVEKCYADDLPRIDAVADQIKQVILNLLQNAEEAILKKGKIKITTEQDGTFVKIHIHDTGIGIPANHMDTIFEPFFTTKPAVKGTGLGLSICYSIIKKHGGTIEIKSNFGVSTTFTVVLPIKSKY